MERISRKGPVKAALEKCLQVYQNEGVLASVAELDQRLLQNKVKFPLLEFCARGLFDALPAAEQLAYCDRIAALQTEGGNVLLGIILQKRLPDHFEQSFEKAQEYIQQGEKWYVCDIIGERVFGMALLTNPARALPFFQQLASHPDQWVKRSLGAGAHYAIKKGLAYPEVQAVFRILLQMANTNNKEVRQGVGWAAKTSAKFHPQLAEQFAREIAADNIPNWFRTKLNIGLERHRYAKGN